MQENRSLVWRVPGRLGGRRAHSAWIFRQRAAFQRGLGCSEKSAQSMRESVGQVPKEQAALSLRRLRDTRTASTSSLRLREVGRERPMSASARGAGSRLEHEDSTARAALVAGECEVLVRIRRHVDLRVMVGAARRGLKLNNVFATLLVTLRLQISDVLFSFLRNSSEDEALDRHQHISSAITIRHDICANTAVLGAWNYSLEHQNFVLNRFRTLSGWRRRLQKNIILTPALPLVWMGDTTPRQQQHQQK